MLIMKPLQERGLITSRQRSKKHFPVKTTLTLGLRNGNIQARSPL